MDEKTIVYHIAGHEFKLQDQIATAAEFVLWGKSLVDSAVRPSIEASLIWAGVCLILPLLTQPHLATEAHLNGFDYVTSRMDFYVALEPKLLPEDTSIPEDLKKAFQKDVVDLYQHVLEFQLQSVLRFYQHSLKRLTQDVMKPDQWTDMLSKVQDAEEVLRKDFDLVNNMMLRQKLNELEENTKLIRLKMGELLTVAEKQLRINDEQLQQAKLTK